MDRITSALLAEFCKSFDLEKQKEDAQFETFATYLTVRKHYSETAFDPSDLVMGSGSDTGIDGLAIIVNNNLVTDVDEVEELAKLNGYLEVAFVFVQAERTAGFDTAKIGQFGFGVRDFFGKGSLPRNDAVKNAAEVMTAIFQHSGRFSKGNPACYLYYVTTGRWQEDANLTTRYRAEVSDLQATGNFSRVEFFPIGADQIQKLYNESKNAITREFVFEQRTVIPDIANVKEAHLGYMGAPEFLKLVCDDEGKIIESLFYENVRGFHGYNFINDQIRKTLESGESDRFVLMNNGVTIIAKSLYLTGHKFTMSDFQIVNGCQTSHVLYDNRGLLKATVRIPLRIISTQDEAVTESIITATNSQTEVKHDQFFALRDFAKKLEAFFSTFSGDKAVYYERRAHQYDSQPVEKTRIIAHQNLVRAVGAMFLEEPHRTTKNYQSLSAKVGKEMFCPTDRMEPYYLAAYSLYRLEYLFRSKKIEAALKPARFHILLAARLLMDRGHLPAMNSHDMQKRCAEMMNRFWNDWEAILVAAAEEVRKVAKGNFDRDYIRTEPITEAILEAFGHKKPGPKSVTTKGAIESKS